jgi:hypothetical protein
MYPIKQMPNPDAASRLIKHGCHVYFAKDTLTSNVKIKEPSDLVLDPANGKRKPDTQESEVCVIKIVMPRHLLTDYNVKKISAMTGEVDLDDVVDAYDQGLDVVRNARDNDDEEANEDPEENY